MIRLSRLPLRPAPARPGFTVPEIVVAMALVVVVAMAAMQWQYRVVIDSQTASAQVKATRMAELILEDWKSRGGSLAYDLNDVGLAFTAYSIPTGFDSGAALGTALDNRAYGFTVDGLPTLLVLRYADVMQDAATLMTVRRIAAVLAAGTVEGGQFKKTGYLGRVFPLTYVTYARVDASGG